MSNNGCVEVNMVVQISNRFSRIVRNSKGGRWWTRERPQVLDGWTEEVSRLDVLNFSLILMLNCCQNPAVHFAL